LKSHEGQQQAVGGVAGIILTVLQGHDEPQAVLVQLVEQITDAPGFAVHPA
jgi:hypothetical protein